MCRDGKNIYISHIFTTFLIIHLTRPKYFAGLTEKTPLVGIKNSTQSLSFNVSEEKILISNGVNEASTKYLNIIIAQMLFHFALSQHLSAMGHTFIKQSFLQKKIRITLYICMRVFSEAGERKINDGSIVESHLVREFNLHKLKTDKISS